MCEVVYEGSRHKLRANRVAWKLMTGEEPEMVDHQNLDVTDDRFDNLRASDRFSNRHNAPGSAAHDLPKGVTRSGKRFRSKGYHKGVVYSFGAFDTASEAHEAYCAWAREIHGEFFNPGPLKAAVFD